MNLSRRRLLHLAGAAGALAATPCRVRAEAYPGRPLRWVVGGRISARRRGRYRVADRGAVAGGTARARGGDRKQAGGRQQHLHSDRGQLAARRLHAPLRPRLRAVNVTLFDNLSFNLLRDIAPVSGLIDFPLVMVANPSLPAKSVGELIAYAKANPGKISIGSFRTGSTSPLLRGPVQ